LDSFNISPDPGSFITDAYPQTAALKNPFVLTDSFEQVTTPGGDFNVAVPVTFITYDVSTKKIKIESENELHVGTYHFKLTSTIVGESLATASKVITCNVLSPPTNPPKN
jgi:hypothetical protein